MIRNERDYATHIDYSHFNPVKHGLVASVADWPYSSFHRSLDMGLYPADWADAAVASNEARVALKGER